MTATPSWPRRAPPQTNVAHCLDATEAGKITALGGKPDVLGAFLDFFPR